MPFTPKTWADIPVELNPAPGETLAVWYARIAAYNITNPGVLTEIDAASLADLETRLSGYTNTELAAAVSALNTAITSAVTTHAGTPHPSSGEKSALAGTNGTPGSGNRYVADSDPRNADQRVPTDASVTAAKVAASLKPSGTAVAGTEALRALGTSASTAAAGNDGRLSDARTPLSHAHPISDVTSLQGTLDAEVTARTNADNALDARVDVLEAGGGGGGADPSIFSAALTDGSDQRSVIMAEVAAIGSANGARYRFKRGTIYTGTSTSVSHTGYGTVKACLHFPNNIEVDGAGATEGTFLRFNDVGLVTGDACIHIYNGGGGRYEHNVLQNLTITTVTATPATFRTQAIPPSAPWGVLIEYGDMESMWFEGNLRSCIATIGNHNNWSRLRLGGYSGIEMPTNFVSIGDVVLEKVIFGGNGYCNILLPSVTGTNRSIQSWTANRVHFGNCAGPCIYSPSTVANQELIHSLRCYGCSIESPSRAFIDDPNKLGAVNDLRLDHFFVGSYYFQTPYPTDGPAPVGPFIRCGTVNRLEVEGPAVFTAPGWDPTTGCVFDVNTFTDSYIGEVGAAISLCEAYGIPFMKPVTILRNVTATAVGVVGSSGVSAQRKVRFMKSAGAVAKGDLVEWTSFLSSDNMQRFATAGNEPAGIALRTASAAATVPVVYANPSDANLYRVGRATLNGGQTHPIAALSSTATLSADLDLGSGAAIARTVESTASGSTSLKITAGTTVTTASVTLPQATIAVRDTAGMPSAGSTVIAGQPVDYTNKTATSLTGCTGGTGTFAAGAYVTSLGDLPSTGLISLGSNVVSYTNMSVDSTSGVLSLTGIPASGSGSITSTVSNNTPLGRVAQVASNSTLAASGVFKNGSTYVRFNGKSGSTYLYGCSSGVTTATVILSGQTITDCNKILVNGLTDGWKQTRGAAVHRSSPNDQLVYGAVVQDKLSALVISYIADITASGTGSYNSGAAITGGTRLNGGVTLPTGTITVYDTTGFPSSGPLLVGGQTVTCTAKTPTTFTITGGSGVIADDAPVTPKPQTIVTGAAKYVRARYSTAATSTDDQGLVTVASGWDDALGRPIGISNAVDDGWGVQTRLALT